ncbi:response regulator transcription factor [Nocardioides sp. zg-536]|uniref:Response regulator transcription factor n=1 Tax=Nocardioides faecalis TaxID=2803858 RepID=A0A938YC94_9ACTN|nr:response regulator transcription factor [Nocardioides faecalis]MBM9461361.1 response regulator transcription factor [Nocardioides faecalis]MBS4752327.1 response regulator transcription factor [Nocardioides faecalis]QVI57630.1 response regulator transcription factor [Nocardioides faecalis]
MSEQITVLLIDDHELIRDGLGAVLDLEPDLAVVATAGSVAEGIARYREHRPAVVITDLQMQDGTGLDVVRTLRKESDTVGLVVLTMHSGDEQIFAAMQAGASGFVGKDAPSTEVIKTARHAAVSPKAFVCAGLVGAMMRRTSAESTALTEREHDVLLLLAEGLNAAAIGAKLYLSESTTKSHIARIYQKLGAANRAQALVTAMRVGLLSTVQPSAR